MKFGWVIGIVVALALHAGFLLFGGLIVGTKKEEKKIIHVVDLLAAEDEKPKDEKKPEEKPEEALEEHTEEVPDAADVIKSLEVSAAAAAPELEAASLAAITDALNAKSAGGAFGDAISFASGGKIGGTGKAGSLGEKIESAFDLSEIDQKPRATFEGPPTYPAEMRGKKVDGVVTLIFIVDSSGKVASPKVEKASHPAFERPALEAVRQWRFEPGLRGGKRVDSKMRRTIRFQKS